MLPKASDQIDFCVISGWTVYTIFILDTLVYLIDINSEHFDKQFGVKPEKVCAVNLFCVLVCYFRKCSYLCNIKCRITSSWFLP